VKYVREEVMILVSDLAKKVLRESLDASGIPQHWGLRLKVNQDQLLLETDHPAEEDLVIEDEGATVVIVGPEVHDEIGDATIDVADNGAGPALVLHRISTNGKRTMS
jgi:Fe-S cluster assembly iron-binding protein IscA